MHPIHVASSKLFEIWGVPISDTILMSWLVMIILITVSFFATRKMALVPSGLQNVMEAILEGIYGFAKDLMGSEKKMRKVFAFATTLLLFILVNNWMGIIPGVGSIGIYKDAPAHEAGTAETTGKSQSTAESTTTHEASVAQEGEVLPEATAEETPAPQHEATASSEGAHAGKSLVYLLRPASSDLSFTIALALLTILYVQAMGMYFAGFSYLKKFFNFTHPIKFFVGILEIISEFSRIVSLAFRLFGNIFAGKVLLIVMIFLVPYVVPVPFYGIELFVGAVQALVFFILTLVFLRGAAEAHH